MSYKAKVAAGDWRCKCCGKIGFVYVSQKDEFMCYDRYTKYTNCLLTEARGERRKNSRRPFGRGEEKKDLIFEI